MNISKIFLIISLIAAINQYNCQINRELDQWLFKFFRILIWKFSEEKKITYHDNKLRGSAQNIISDSTNFFCDTNNSRSKFIPNSVHRLRPGDINVIAAIGESISAGSGGISNNLFHMGKEYRGVSFTGGGISNWRQFITLPNILKEFNSNLYGYAISDGFTIDRKSRFNIAEPMLMSADLPYSTNILLRRIKFDPKVNLNKDWKIVTIFVGNLDVCSDSCHAKNLNIWLKNFEINLVKSLRMLRDNLPHLYVNLVPIPNLVRLLHSIKLNTTTCYLMHHFFCPCFFKSYYKESDLLSFENIIKMWNEKELEISLRDEFQTDDFTVNVQPFLSNFSFYMNAEGKENYNLIAKDCFHFSQLGHAIAAISLWNNMLQPLGMKNVGVAGSRHIFLCPSEIFPYLATYKNIQKEIWRPNLSVTAEKVLKNIAVNY